MSSEIENAHFLTCVKLWRGPARGAVRWPGHLLMNPFGGPGGWFPVGVALNAHAGVQWLSSNAYHPLGVNDLYSIGMQPTYM